MESSFGKKLASTEQDIRDKAIRTLRKWLKTQGATLCYKEYLRLWKGLFYSMWMADKPKYQHELAERLANITTVLPCDYTEGQEEDEEKESELPAALMFLKAFWETVCREWGGLDRLRLNKFYNLMKEFMLVGFELLGSANFEYEITSAYFGIIQDFPLNVTNDKVPAAIKVYFIENYLPCLETLGQGYDPNMSMLLLSPLVDTLATAKEKTVLKALEASFAAAKTHHFNADEEEGSQPEGEELESGDEASMESGDEDHEMEDGSEGGEEMEEAEELSESDVEDDDSGMFDLRLMSHVLFGVGSEPEVSSVNRKLLYKISNLYKDIACDPSEIEEDGCGDCCEHDHEDHLHGSDSGSCCDHDHGDQGDGEEENSADLEEGKESSDEDLSN